MTAQSTAPVVSVIVATYDWSTALRCALRSIAMQTMADFEVLVVGDGCGDNSAAVVAEFKDPRFRWFNLDTHHGSQYGPNNHGLDHARGAFVAYLGHDDIWHPDHLAVCLATAERTGAAYVASVAVLHGPETSSIRGLSGVPAGDAASPIDFFPPSSIMHRRSMVAQTGRWSPPGALPVDVEFQLQATRAGIVPVTTGQLTVFKFNSAWRRNSYLSRSVADQEALLVRLAAQEDVRTPALMSVLKAVVAGQFVAIEIPDRSGGERDATVTNRKIRGLAAPFAPEEMAPPGAVRRFPVWAPIGPFEWHEAEEHAELGPFRWSGPLRQSSIALPLRFERDVLIQILVLRALEPDWFDGFRLWVNDRPTDCARSALDGSASVVTAWARASPEDGTKPLTLVLEIRRTVRPIDLGSQDRRWMGIAVGWIEVTAIQGAVPWA